MGATGPVCPAPPPVAKGTLEQEAS